MDLLTMLYFFASEILPSSWCSAAWGQPEVSPGPLGSARLSGSLSPFQCVTHPGAIGLPLLLLPAVPTPTLQPFL